MNDWGWISVKDRLPEDYEYVLVYAENFGTGEPSAISFARISMGKWQMLNETSINNAVACGDLLWDMTADDISYWMPLKGLSRE